MQNVGQSERVSSRVDFSSACRVFGVAIYQGHLPEVLQLPTCTPCLMAPNLRFVSHVQDAQPHTLGGHYTGNCCAGPPVTAKGGAGALYDHLALRSPIPLYHFKAIFSTLLVPAILPTRNNSQIFFIHSLITVSVFI